MLAALMAIAFVATGSTEPFSFRGMTTATTESDAIRQGLVENCRKHPIPQVRECQLTNHELAGFSTLFATAQFRNGTLVNVHALVTSKHFLPLAQALVERYGQLCLTNPPGNPASSGENGYWCFSDGAVRLRQFGTGGMTSFEFYARSYDDIIADLKAKIDF